jgi:hypothetical protein
MAQLHPSTPVYAQGAGAYRERQVLRQLQDGLPPSFDVFHNLAWSAMAEGSEQIGEIDIAVVAPSGHILLLEVKAGPVIEAPQKLLKDYGTPAKPYTKDVGAQVRRQHTSLLGRMQSGDLPAVHLSSLLVLPDHQIAHGSLAYPRERIVDASDIEQLCTRITQSFLAPRANRELPAAQRLQVIDFLSNRFQVVPDVSTHLGQVQQANTQLASGMAEWVPNVQHSQRAYVIEATAGSGKTQLALGLLQAAVRQKLKSRYVCFNRPLADHLAQLAPAQVDVTTFHQLCRDHAERQGQTLDFDNPEVFNSMVQSYVQQAETEGQAPATTLDLLIIDESQDMQPEWVQTLMLSLKADGRLYLMGDPDQQLYKRDNFGLPDAVHISCMDNFRSPRQVVQTINALGLTHEPIKPRSVFDGDAPSWHQYGPGQGGHLTVLNRCLQQLWQQGLRPEQVAVISYRGFKNAQVSTQAQLGGQATRRYTGQHDKAGNPRWTEGPLLVESLYRFKGQSMPVVVLCEVDFETLTELDRSKLFVGLTRAQLQVEVVISQRAASALEQPPGAKN